MKPEPPSPAEAGPRLDRLAVPVLVFCGDSNMLLTVDNAQRLADAIPGSHLRVLSGSGHMPHQHKPDEFAAMVQQWVAEW